MLLASNTFIFNAFQLSVFLFGKLNFSTLFNIQSNILSPCSSIVPYPKFFFAHFFQSLIVLSIIIRSPLSLMCELSFCGCFIQNTRNVLHHTTKQQTTSIYKDMERPIFRISLCREKRSPGQEIIQMKTVPDSIQEKSSLYPPSTKMFPIAFRRNPLYMSLYAASTKDKDRIQSTHVLYHYMLSKLLMFRLRHNHSLNGSVRQSVHRGTLSCMLHA